jgi:hypothetical protein
LAEIDADTGAASLLENWTGEVNGICAGYFQGDLSVTMTLPASEGEIDLQGSHFDSYARAYADVAGFSMRETDENTIVSESGTTDALGVMLTTRPLDDVVIVVTSDDATEVTTSTTRLTFTPSTWNVAQMVILSGQDDLIADGDQRTTVTMAIDDPASDDAFDAIASQTVTVVTVDDEMQWHNAALPEDVNGDDLITISDLRMMFTYISTVGLGPLDPRGPANGSTMIDVDNNGSAGLTDLRRVFNRLTVGSPDGDSEPESESDAETSWHLFSAPPSRRFIRQVDWWLPSYSQDEKPQREH